MVVLREWNTVVHWADKLVDMKVGQMASPGVDNSVDCLVALMVQRLVVKTVYRWDMRWVVYLVG